MIYNNILEMIGNTPLLYLPNISKKYNNNIYVKVEGVNPFGSIKDRPSLNMIEKLILENKINKDTLVIEATSGNTGIGLSGVCKSKGLKCTIVMPENASVERVKILKAYNANVVLTPKELGMSGAIDYANNLCAQNPNSVIVNQFENENNLYAHIKTAEEINDDLKSIYAIISTIGTGGTITGIGKFYKEKNIKTKIIGVEPKESNVITGGKKGSHSIDGIGAGFIPKILNLDYIDEVLTVESAKVSENLNELVDEEAFFSGFSTSAAFCAVKQLITNHNIKGENIVFISPDFGTKYLSKL